MTPDKDAAQLHDEMYRVYESQKHLPAISPAWLATKTMDAINFPRALHPLGYLGCHLQLRQMARRFCREEFDPAETTQGELFQGALQQRYPRCPSENETEPVYVLRDLLLETDVKYNTARLRKEADAKLKHADALEAWWHYRKAARAA